MAAYCTDGLSRVTSLWSAGFYRLMPSRKRLVVAGLATLVGVLIGIGGWAVVAALRPQATTPRPTPSRSGASATASPSASAQPSATNRSTPPPPGMFAVEHPASQPSGS